MKTAAAPLVTLAALAVAVLAVEAALKLPPLEPEGGPASA